MILALIYLSMLLAPPVELEPVATLDHPPLAEVSGMVASERYPGLFWVVNDSGDSARVFAVDADGEAIMPAFVEDAFWVGQERPATTPWPGIQIGDANNHDWESLAMLDGKLLICDVGNNSNARRDLGLYMVAEPNPAEVTQARVLDWVAFHYPDQYAFPGDEREFDCEAVFSFDGAVYFLTKHRAPGSNSIPAVGTKLYRLTSLRTDRLNTLTFIDEADYLGGWVTGADVSPDGRWVAILCQFPEQSVWLFRAERLGLSFFQAPVKRIRFTGGRQCEAISFSQDGKSLIIANEQRDLFRIEHSLPIESD